MVSAVFGPLPVEEGIARCREFLARRRRRPDDPRDVLGRARRARGDARRHRVGAGAPGRGAEDDRGIRPHALGRAQRAGDLSRRAARRHAGGGRRDPARELRRRSTEGGERAYLSTHRGLPRARALRRRARTTRRSASAARASRPPRPTTCSHRCSGGRRGRRSWRGGASSSRPRRSRARPSTIGEPTDLLGTRADALSTSPRCSRSPGGARTRWPRSARPRAVRAEGKPDRPRAGPRASAGARLTPPVEATIFAR